MRATATIVVKVATNVARRIAQASPYPGQRHTTTHLYVKYSTAILIDSHEDDNSYKNDRWSAGTTQQSLNEYGNGVLRRTIVSAGWPPNPPRLRASTPLPLPQPKGKSRNGCQPNWFGLKCMKLTGAFELPLMVCILGLNRAGTQMYAIEKHINRF